MKSEPVGATVKSADRALAIIEFVAENGPVRFQDVVTDLALARSSAHGLVRTLIAGDWLQQNPDRTYSLGLRAWQVGQKYTGHRALADVARDPMDRLAARVGETVQLARLDGIENVYIAISESTNPFRLASSVGMRLHSHATALGKALLSQLDPDEARRRLTSVALPTFTDTTIDDPDALMAEIDQARKRGYSTDEGEYLAGTRCVAVPLFDDGRGLITALSVTAPAVRTGPDWPAPVLDELLAAAAEIRSGFSPGDNADAM